MPKGVRGFAKGQSGNPGGRKKGEAEALAKVRAKAQEHGIEAVEFLVELMKNEEAGMRDRVTAALGLLDRGFGKPVQPQEVNLNENAKVAIITDQPMTEAEWMKKYGM